MKYSTMFKQLMIAAMVLSLGAGAAFAAEPNMRDYQALPINMSNTVPPNIMVILDNSGSMQNLAYEDYSYQGEPYNSLSGIGIAASADDAEETKTIGSDPYLWSVDLDLGEQHVALRFQDVNISQGATIKSARIEFVADYTRSGAMDLEIYGLAADNADPWPDRTDNYLKDLLSPPQTGLTAASEPWNVTARWYWRRSYSTPDLTAIVQEIVNRGGWTSGNSMAFVIEGINGKRDVYSREGSWTRRPVLFIEADGGGEKYFGYFNPDYFYRFDAGLNYFVPAFKKAGYDMTNSQWNAETLAGAPTTLTDVDIAPSGFNPEPENGLWDGNWLNWCCMRRMDVVRKVMVGGTAKDLAGNLGEYAPGLYARDGSGRQRNVGVWQDTWWETMSFDSRGNGPAVSPYDGYYFYSIYNGQILVDFDIDRIPIDVLKDSTIDEADFFEGNLAGLVQRIGEQARWGNIWFNYPSTNGGKVENVINSDIMDLVHSLESKPGKTFTPLAETFYVGMQYFRQQGLGVWGYPSDSLDSNSLGVGTAKDPFWDQDSFDATGDGFIECAKSYVIFLTDGQPTLDGRIPSEFKDYDKDGHAYDSCTVCSSNALDDLALYAHVNDLRTDTGLPGDQNLTLYTIYAFDDNATARQLLMDAARNGGFKDRDGGTPNRPDGTYTDPPDARLEWDEDGDAIPDTYFEASDGYALQAQMSNAFLSIFERASSGTAASVLSTNVEGEGNSVQAYYKPIKYEQDGSFREARWLGYLQSLWLDQWGNLREDTVQNKRLDAQNWPGNNTGDATPNQVDRIVKFIQKDGEVFIRKYTKHYLYNPLNGNSDECIVADCEILPSDDQSDEPLSSLDPLFEAGEVLSRRDPDTRQIFTYLDADQDQVVDGGELVSFELANRSDIKPYLGVRDNGTWGVGGARLGSSHDDRTDNIITWIRGQDVPGLRNRTLYDVTWPLGDIIHSTPMTIGKPEERFDIIYQDPTYREFYLAHKNRETMIYAGSNDGMLHAFTSWQYQRPEIDPSGGTNLREMSTYVPVGTEEMGTELWAYIPQAVLPHLKWTAHKGYTHTYYVDAKPRVFDARIGNSSIPAEQWRTIMVFGLNFGGKEIDVTDDFGSGVVTRTFKPTYVCMDITEPRNPVLLWERSYDNLGFAWAEPSPIRIGKFDSADPGQWFLAFGSGPTRYDGSSNRGSYLFVVDMKTGEPYGTGGNDWHSGPYDTNASFISSLAVDVQRPSNYNVDAIYFPNNYDDGTEKAKIYRMGVKCSPCSWDSGFDPDNDEPTYSANPLDWVVRPIFESDRPISKKLTAAHGSKRNMDHLWLYAGTGRFLNEDDKLDTDQNFVYGIQEPFFNPDHTNYRDMSGPVTPLTVNQLFESNDFSVLANEDVMQGGSAFAPAPDFNGFVNYVIDNYDGWYYRLDSGSGPSERIISRSTAFGRYLWVPSYTPSEDICLPGGFTQFYGFYYETGTNTAADVFGNQTVKYDTAVIGPPPPKIGVHMGREGGAKIILQQGSGAVESIDVDKFYRVGNGVADWWNEKK